VTIYQCANPATWHPTMHCRQQHHHPPLSWRRDMAAAGPTDESWWRIIPLCGLCHDEYHTLLNGHVRAGGPPPYAERRTYSLFIQRLVAEAWASRPSTKPPYTEAH
jgi:hypothetical protein